MCCYIDKSATEKFVKKLKSARKQWFWAYKQLKDTGESLHAGDYQYKIGENKADKKK